MKSDPPSHGRGIGQQARETAREAARRAGMSVSEWLDSIIIDAAQERGIAVPPRTPRTEGEPSTGTTETFVPPPFANGEFIPGTKSNEPESEPTQAGAPFAGEGLAEVKERLDSLARALAEDGGMAEVRQRLDILTQNLAQDDGIVEINTRLDNLTQQLETLARLNAASAEASRQDPQVAEVISRLDRRLDEIAADNRSARTEIEQRLHAVNEAVTGLGTEARLAASATPLDRAMAEIADRQRELDSLGDDRSAPSVPNTAPAGLPPRAQTREIFGLEQQLREINAQIGMLSQSGGIDKAVDLLRDDLAEIGVMLQDAMPRRAIEALEAEMRKLSERIDQTRDTGAAGMSLAGVERGLAEIRDALRMLTPAENLAGLDETVRVLSDKIDLIAGNTQDPAALKQLEGAIVAMRGIVTHVASNDALANLSAEVRALSAKVDQMTGPAGDPGVLARLDQRIGTLSDAFELRSRSSDDISRELEQVLAGLSEKVELIQAARNGEISFTQLEERISHLMHKLEASDQRLNHLEGIERGISDLVTNLEQHRLPVRATSEPAPEVDALVRDVTGLKQMERQTQDTLEGVHGALETVVERLATIEGDLRERFTLAVSAVVAASQGPKLPDPPGRGAPASTTPAAPPAPAQVALSPAERPAAEPKAERSDPAPSALAPSSTSGLAPRASDTADIETTPLRASPSAAGERRPIDPNLPPDHPLEPGVSRNRYPATPADRIAASEAAIGAVKPPVIPDPAGKSNFIAAARRAAQAATGDAPARSPRTSDTAGPKAAAPTMFPNLFRRHARSLIIGASVLAIVLGSINIVNHWLADEPKATANGEAVSPPARDAAPVTNGSSSGSRTSAEPAPAPAAKAPERHSTLLPTPALPAASALPNFPATGALPAPAPAPAASETTGTVAPAEPVAAPAPRPAPVTVAAPAIPAPAALVTPNDLPSAITGTLRAAAAKGDPAAQFEIALRFADGRGLPQNLNAAADWFERAAKQGLAPAQFRLGGLYEKGLGVKKDLEAARRYYAQAGEAGNAKALHNLAVLYAEGVDGKPDYQTAAQWFRKAANYGMADSQYNLGVLYARGIGVEQNQTEAYRWFGLAARSGDKESERKRDELGARLDAQSLQNARQAIEAFKPEVQPEAATQVKVPGGGWEPAAAAPAGKRRSSAQDWRQEATSSWFDFPTRASGE